MTWIILPFFFSNQSVKSPVRKHSSLRYKVLRCACLWFHTQLRRVCKLHLRVSERNTNQATPNTCRDSTLPVPQLHLFPSLLHFSPLSHIFRCTPEHVWPQHLRPRCYSLILWGNMDQNSEFPFAQSCLFLLLPSPSLWLRVKTDHGEPEPCLDLLFLWGNTQQYDARNAHPKTALQDGKLHKSVGFHNHFHLGQNS